MACFGGTEMGGKVTEARAQIEISTPPEAAWAVVGDFGGIGEWMPGIDSCVVDGEDRILRLAGLEIIERLESRDEDAWTISYRVVSGVPVINHRATISVAPSDGGSTVVWDVEVEPEEMVELFQPTYQQALGALKEHLGG